MEKIVQLQQEHHRSALLQEQYLQIKPGFGHHIASEYIADICESAAREFEPAILQKELLEAHEWMRASHTKTAEAQVYMDQTELYNSMLTLSNLLLPRRTTLPLQSGIHTALIDSKKIWRRSFQHNEDFMKFLDYARLGVHDLRMQRPIPLFIVHIEEAYESVSLGTVNPIFSPHTEDMSAVGLQLRGKGSTEPIYTPLRLSYSRSDARL